MALGWRSQVWSVRDKLIATLVPPGGLFPAFFLAFGSGSTETCTGGITASGASWEHCTGGRPSTLTQVLAVIALAFLVILPFLTTAYLHRRAQRDPPATTRERLAPA